VAWPALAVAWQWYQWPWKGLGLRWRCAQLTQAAPRLRESPKCRGRLDGAMQPKECIVPWMHDAVKWLHSAVVDSERRGHLQPPYGMCRTLRIPQLTNRGNHSRAGCFTHAEHTAWWDRQQGWFQGAVVFLDT